MSSNATPLKIVLGVANVGDSSDPTVRYSTPDEVNAYLNAFHDRGGRELDTARMYSTTAPGSSEVRLGAISAGEKFLVDTKVFSFVPGSHAKAKILESVDASEKALKCKANIEYLHAPDRSVPFEETLGAMDEAYRAGKFKYLGLSNYAAHEVEQIVKICEEKEFCKPSVYQGQYNPIVRSGEKELFPMLRKHGIAFYAWSPAAAGLFAGNHKNVKAGDRFDTSHVLGQTFARVFLNDTIIAAVDRVFEIFAKHSINGHGAALRWTVHHSKLEADCGDAVVIAASSVAQLDSNLDFIAEGPLPAEVAEAIEKVYGEIADAAFPYHI
ncbi:uncharacterized protein LTR77_002785 [Saxophila tyrrhenica]|uniref:NADP-dependent oxidoreductase domain-containing protein n=1 Tax=Saxophila tyrrhenica TaxID=1690608 RepID=A0AAV9PK16_9PEZI|nr:hypothetical protein LTR77_002785 [Saxophila tyrrhenica]